MTERSNYFFTDPESRLTYGDPLGVLLLDLTGVDLSDIG